MGLNYSLKATFSDEFVYDCSDITSDDDSEDDDSLDDFASESDALDGISEADGEEDDSGSGISRT